MGYIYSAAIRYIHITLQEGKMKNYFKGWYRFLTTAIIFITLSLQAQWSGDPTVNSPICAAGWNQTSPSLVSDGAGGAIIAFEYYHTFSTLYDIYVQHIDANGVLQWPVDGVPISTAAFDQRLRTPSIISDGAGGAIICWEDSRNGGSNVDIFAQRIDSSGTVQWTTDGVEICTATYSQFLPSIVSDGAGGAIICWEDSRNGISYDIYAQHIDANGVLQWTSNGIAICTANYDQTHTTIISDGSNGAIILWRDQRILSNNAIYAQHVDAGGILHWSNNGVLISQTGGYPYAIGDGAGGAIITWQAAGDIHAQRIAANGSIQWGVNSVPICTAANNQDTPQITGDGNGGAIITWSDRRSVTNSDIYVQHINEIGVNLWDVDGVPISIAASNQNAPTITDDGAGGAIITWYDIRGPNYDIYAQCVDSSGAVQ